LVPAQLQYGNGLMLLPIFRRGFPAVEATSNAKWQDCDDASADAVPVVPRCALQRGSVQFRAAAGVTA